MSMPQKLGPKQDLISKNIASTALKSAKLIVLREN